MGVGTGGAQGARAPPIILPSKLFQCSKCTLIKEIGTKTCIFIKICRLASLADLDINLSIQTFKLFHPGNVKTSHVGSKQAEVSNQVFYILSPTLKIRYNFIIMNVRTSSTKKSSEGSVL